MTATRQFISLGAGVQSSTMALMAAAGEITPMPEAAIFADTQAEPASVYDWLDWLEKQLPFPVVRVTHGDLESDSLRRRTSKLSGKRYVSNGLPLWIEAPDGSRGLSTRKCTRDYKITPILRHMRNALGFFRKRSPKSPVATSWIGISTDEIVRMKPSREPWVDHRWPLIDMGVSRAGCKEWMAARGFPEPPRSACVFCPFHDVSEWARLQRDEPKEFAHAADFEARLVSAFADHDEVIRGVPYLFQGMTRLADTDFVKLEAEAKGEHPKQQTMFSQWANECEGMCGV